MRDGSRANAVIEPVGGPSLSIRKFRPLSMPLAGPAWWVACGALSGVAAALLVDAVRRRRNVLISGATGSGKSTLLRSLASAIPADERIIVIEDTTELVLPHHHALHLECVPSRDGGIGVADLVVNALRMRPDRIIVGEVRSPREASALLEALSTGHAGSLTTLHAGSAREALRAMGVVVGAVLGSGAGSPIVGAVILGLAPSVAARVGAGAARDRARAALAPLLVSTSAGLRSGLALPEALRRSVAGCGDAIARRPFDDALTRFDLGDPLDVALAFGASRSRDHRVTDAMLTLALGVSQRMPIC